MNNTVLHAKHTGMIILGGGLSKHHICNTNAMVGIFFNWVKLFPAIDRATVSVRK